MTLRHRADRVAVRLLERVPPGIAARVASESVAARLVRPVVNRFLPAGEIVVSVSSGPARGLRVPIEPRHEKFYWTGGYELPVQAALVRSLSAGGVFWDIGAHAGFFTVLGARLVGDTGRVLAVEPIAENRRRLLESIRLNRLENVVVLPYAVAAEPGKGVLYAEGASSMWTLRRRDGTTEQAVECLSLAGLSELAPSPPDVVKIDVEGAELDVLRGGVELLLDVRPKLIVEFVSEQVVDAARALLPPYRFERLGERQWLLT